MQLKTSEFQSLFSDGLNGLAGKMGWIVLCCLCPSVLRGKCCLKHPECTSIQLKHTSLYCNLC